MGLSDSETHAVSTEAPVGENPTRFENKASENGGLRNKNCFCIPTSPLKKFYGKLEKASAMQLKNLLVTYGNDDYETLLNPVEGTTPRETYSREKHMSLIIKNNILKLHEEHFRTVSSYTRQLSKGSR